MRDDAGNLIKLHITPLTTTTPPPAPTVKSQPPSDKKSHRSEAAEGMDVDITTEAKTTTSSVKRKTRPISQRKSTAAKSTERGSLLNFRGYGAVDQGRPGGGTGWRQYRVVPIKWQGPLARQYEQRQPAPRLRYFQFQGGEDMGARHCPQRGTDMDARERI